MTRVLYILLLLSVIFITSESISIQPSDFCKKQNCSCDAEKLIVNCFQNKFDKMLNASELWMNKNESNQSYPFYKVSVKDSGISVISPFPNSSLKILDLSENRIQVIEDESFKYLQNMTELDLSDNELNSESLKSDIFKGLYTPDQYLPLKSLKILKLANNQLHTLQQNVFEHITHLEVLDLHGNEIRVLDSHITMAITGLMNLKELDLSYTFIKKIPDDFFHSPRKIEKMNLAGNLLKYVPTAALEEATSLKYLNLNENPIENITKETGFPKLEHLKILHMCYMDQLQEIGKGSLSGLWNLEELYISNNQKLSKIDDMALARIEEGAESKVWPKITKLHIDHNQLSNLGSSLLADWHLLVDLNINDNPWICDCENQWVINELVPMAIDEKKSNKRALMIHCGAPPPFKYQNLVDLFRSNTTMRCLPSDGGLPEKDAGILIGILIGLLVGIPTVLGLLLCYKRNWFGLFNKGPASFSRTFYSQTTTDEDFA